MIQTLMLGEAYCAGFALAGNFDYSQSDRSQRHTGIKSSLTSFFHSDHPSDLRN